MVGEYRLSRSEITLRSYPGRSLFHTLQKAINKHKNLAEKAVNDAASDNFRNNYSVVRCETSNILQLINYSKSSETRKSFFKHPCYIKIDLQIITSLKNLCCQILN